MTALAAMPHMKMPIWIFWRHLAGLSLYSAPPRAEIAVAKSSHPLSVSFSTGGMSANGMVRPRQRFMLARGANDKGARHVSDTQDCRNRYRQELIPCCRP